MAFEIMHSMSLKRKGKRGQMALKLDLSKAYDRVEWAFLEGIMRHMGFAEEWIRLLMMCVNSVSFSVLLNGEQCGFFTEFVRGGLVVSLFILIVCGRSLFPPQESCSR